MKNRIGVLLVVAVLSGVAMKRLNLKSICLLLSALTSMAFSAAVRADTVVDSQPSPASTPDSLQIALKSAAGNLNADNTTYKTLRGWLMSVPVSRSEPRPSLCTGAASANLH